MLEASCETQFPSTPLIRTARFAGNMTDNGMIITPSRGMNRIRFEHHFGAEGRYIDGFFCSAYSSPIAKKVTAVV